MENPESIKELRAIREEVSIATDRIFDAVDAAQKNLQVLRDVNVEAADAVQQSLCEIVEALSFQDLTGQRISRVEALICAAPAMPSNAVASRENSLENGPALPGAGLRQDDVDSILSGPQP